MTSLCGDQLTIFGFALSGLIAILVFVPPLIYSYAKDLLDATKELDSELQQRAKQYFFATDQIVYIWGIHALYGIVVAILVLLHSRSGFQAILFGYITLLLLTFGVSAFVLQLKDRVRAWKEGHAWFWVATVFMMTLLLNLFSIVFAFAIDFSSVQGFLNSCYFALGNPISSQSAVVWICWTFISTFGYFVLWWFASIIYKPLEALTKDAKKKPNRVIVYWRRRWFR